MGNSAGESSTTRDTHQRTVFFRSIFVLCLLVAAIACGLVGYKVTTDLETDVGVQTFKSVANSALAGARALTERKAEGGDVMATVLSFAFPNASQWPFIALPGYVEISNKVSKLSSSTGQGLIAFVRPDEAEAFEAHAKQVYKEQGYPESAGYSEFGFGVYGTNPSVSNYSDNRFHDVSGENNYGSENTILAPFLQHSVTFRNPGVLMMNLHQKAFRGMAIDSMMACAEAVDPNSAESPSCGVATDFTELFVQPGPASIFKMPIFPANDPTTIVGYIGNSINWAEVLTNTVPDYVDGLICVISSATAVYTYEISKGVPKLLGPGDRHDEKFDDYGDKHSVILNDASTNAAASTPFRLTIYPSDVMFDEFRTSVPLYASLGFMGVILFCTAMFFLYDFFMQFESRQRKLILEVKRRFVRYISHEIRTPLNTVCMGLELLQAEIRDKMESKPDDAKNRITTHCGTDASSMEEAAVNDKSQQLAVGLSNQETAMYWLDLTGDILENTQNAVSVLNDLLNYDKIESGTFRLEVKTVDIWRLLRKTVSEFQIQAKNRKISLNFSIENDPGKSDSDKDSETAYQDKLRVVGDDVRLTQVVRNLISNGLKFAPEEGTIDVVVTRTPFGLPEFKQLETTDDKEADIARSRAGTICITVKDDGVGLTKEQLGKLFGEGVQFDSNKLQAGGGSGLGLHITKEIVEQHKGTIEAHSQGRGSGTTFIIQLPLYECEMDKTEPAQVVSNSETCTTTNTFSGNHPHHILVVDDVISNSKMLSRLLERAGHTCVVANNGQEAIDAFLANKASVETMENGTILFDTILIDFEMPLINGPEATRKMRDMGCEASVFGVTGNILPEDVAYFKDHGADHVLPKPVNVGLVNSCWASMAH